MLEDVPSCDGRTKKTGYERNQQLGARGSGGRWVKTSGRFPLEVVLCDHSADGTLPVGVRPKLY